MLLAGTWSLTCILVNSFPVTGGGIKQLENHFATTKGDNEVKKKKKQTIPNEGKAEPLVRSLKSLTWYLVLFSF